MTETAFVAERMIEPYPPGIEDHFWTLARNKVVLREIRAAEARMGKLDRLLEIGCGRGVVLKYLRDQGVDCDGVEPSPIALSGDLASNVRGGIDCFHIPADERAGYDGLLLLDVLEHIAEPIDFLRQVRLAYPNARVLILTVPARTELWSNYDEHFGHFRRYSLQTLAVELRGANLANVHARYFFHALYPVMLVIKFLRGNRSTTTHAPDKPGLHRFIAGCFAAEEWLLPGYVPGTSIIARASLSQSN
jgi:SAM-dependent methyltransferase